MEKREVIISLIFKILFWVKTIIITLVISAILSFILAVSLLTALQNGWILSNHIPDNQIIYDSSMQFFIFIYICIAFAVFIRQYASVIAFGYPIDMNPLGRATSNGDKSGELKTMQNEDSNNIRVLAIHEAGHSVLAKSLGIPVKEKEVFYPPRGNVGGRVIYDLPFVWTPEMIKKRVLLCYAGLIAEKMILGEATNGCMGIVESDLEQANQYLRQYVVLNDEELSLTALECEERKVNEKIVCLSKEWEKETVEIMSQMKHQILDEAELLLDQYYQKRSDTLYDNSKTNRSRRIGDESCMGL